MWVKYGNSCTFDPQEVTTVQIRTDGSIKSHLKKLLPVSTTEDLLQKTQAQPGDLLLIAAGSLHTVVRHGWVL